MLLPLTVIFTFSSLILSSPLSLDKEFAKLSLSTCKDETQAMVDENWSNFLSSLASQKSQEHSTNLLLKRLESLVKDRITADLPVAVRSTLSAYGSCEKKATLLEYIDSLYELAKEADDLTAFYHEFMTANRGNLAAVNVEKLAYLFVLVDNAYHAVGGNDMEAFLQFILREKSRLEDELTDRLETTDYFVNFVADQVTKEVVLRFIAAKQNALQSSWNFNGPESAVLVSNEGKSSPWSDIEIRQYFLNCVGEELDHSYLSFIFRALFETPETVRPLLRETKDLVLLELRRRFSDDAFLSNQVAAIQTIFQTELVNSMEREMISNALNSVFPHCGAMEIDSYFSGVSLRELYERASQYCIE